MVFLANSFGKKLNIMFRIRTTRKIEAFATVTSLEKHFHQNLTSFKRGTMHMMNMAFCQLLYYSSVSDKNICDIASSNGSVVMQFQPSCLIKTSASNM
jgi:hypothetical protein